MSLILFLLGASGLWMIAPNKTSLLLLLLLPASLLEGPGNLDEKIAYIMYWKASISLCMQSAYIVAGNIATTVFDL